MTSIERVAIVGGGLMGSTLAAACAVAGARVLLVRARPGAGGADVLARAQAVARDDAERAAIAMNVSVASLDTNPEALRDSDWICECVVEQVAPKRDVLARIEAARGAHSVVSTMSSGLTLASLSEGLPERLRRDLFATHFFNPLRVMKGLELASPVDFAAGKRDALAAFCRDRLGKGVVLCNDTPNFIANRVGVFMMLAGVHKTKPYLSAGKTQEWADAVMSAPFGMPAMGLYGLIDLTGIDIGHRIAMNLEKLLPPTDLCLAYTRYPLAEQILLETGQVGRGSGGGYYRIATPPGGAKRREVFDLMSWQWRAASRVRLAAPHDKAATLLFADSPEGHYAWDLMGATLLYATGLVPEVADTIISIDQAMRWCFGWARGPFELLDTVGPRRVAERALAERGRLPAMLDVLWRAEAATFYQDGAYLGVDGVWHALPEEQAGAA